MGFFEDMSLAARMLRTILCFFGKTLLLSSVYLVQLVFRVILKHCKKQPKTCHIPDECKFFA
jgi:hypothetical protein